MALDDDVWVNRCGFSLPKESYAVFFKLFIYFMSDFHNPLILIFFFDYIIILLYHYVFQSVMSHA